MAEKSENKFDGTVRPRLTASRKARCASRERGCVLNVVVLTIVQIVREYAFAPVWCFYAAIMTVMIYWQFRRNDISVLDGKSMRRTCHGSRFAYRKTI